MSVVQAVCESTERYLEFLRQQRQGATRHAITSIKRLPEATLLSAVLRHTYTGKLPPRLALLQDSSATLILDPTPDIEIEIHILAYDRSTGHLKFSAREPITAETGQVLVDFIWLVRRCLEWYQNRGITIPDSLPQITHGLIQCPTDSLPNELSSEKIEAIQTLLQEPFSYIWGPPGTGKTNWVLAKAAKLCLDRGEKIIVLASTNLAVDNALEAILNEGIPEEDVLRLGVPGTRFVASRRKCCEARAFQEEIAHLRVEIANLESVIRIAEEVIKTEDHLRTERAQLSRVERELETNQIQLQSLVQEEATSVRLHRETEEKLFPREAERVKVTKELEALGFDDLVSEIADFETAQTRAIRRRSALSLELDTMGWLKKLLTGRRSEVEHLVEVEGAHLRSVEGTLESKRSKRDSLSPGVTALKTRLQDLAESCERALVDTEAAKCRCDTVASRHRAQFDKVSELLRSRDAVLAQTRAVEEHLCSLQDEELGGRPVDVEELRKRRMVLEDELMKYQPDLARKSVLGMTLDGFIGLTLVKSLVVDRVFIDEAPYAPLAKVLPLLGLRRPIAMLGDHKQLPPVCECSNDAVIQAFWAKPSIFLESMFDLPWVDGDASFMRLHKLSEPLFDQIKLRTLTCSFRFGNSLARLLDQHIYEMGLRGLAETDTLIRCFHCEPGNSPNRSRWQNPAECEMILDEMEDWWDQAREINPIPTVAILTPYKAQATLLRRRLRARFGNSALASAVEILNTHQAQGREWDWVLFSVVDTGRLQGNGPFLADTKKAEGKPLVNTTLSRAKKHLHVFLDLDYWEKRKPSSLITDLAKNYRA